MKPNKLEVRDRKERGKLLAIWAEAHNATRKCLTPGCTKSAIKSHWLQRNGILSHITAADGHVVQWTPTHAFTDRGFERTSAKKSAMLAFPGFCNECDKSIFAPIEDAPPVFSDFKQQLLFCYRGMLQGYRKTEMIYDNDNKILSAKSGISMNWKMHTERGRREHLMKLKVLSHYKLLFEKEIYGNYADSVFNIFHASMSRLDVAASLQIGLGYVLRSYSDIVKINPLNIDKRFLTYAFVLVIPSANSSELLICWLKGTHILGEYGLPSIEELTSFSDKQLVQLVSDFLSGCGENWAISDKLCSELQAHGVDKEFMRIKNNNILRVSYKYPMPKEEFNMFEGLAD